MTSTCPPELKILYRQNRVIPFVGAGVSMSVTWTAPDGETRRGISWTQLVDEAARLLDTTADDANLLRTRGTDLQILEYFLAKKNTYAPLTNWLYTYMQPTDEALQKSVLHRALSKMLECKLFYTTNFDNFLEKALTLAGHTVRVVRSA